MMRPTTLALLLTATLGQAPPPPAALPETAAAQLQRSLEASRRHAVHVWRDTPPLNSDGTVNGYIEIPRGERRKFEFDMSANARKTDRVMPRSLGGYPINYGFVPQSVSYDGDPFDILVLGPPLRGGSLVRGAIVGLMQMEDEKGLDSKVVVSPVDQQGRALYALTPAVKARVQRYFQRYKLHEPGKFSKVPGWGTAEEGRAYVETTHRFFQRSTGK